MKRIAIFLLPLLMILFMSSCHKDRIDYGYSFLRLEYHSVQPDYIDTYDTPLSTNFYWGTDYRVSPGNYSLYYEGHYHDTYGYVEYAWEIFYEIYRYKDYDIAPDVYFTIECNPEGPYMYDDVLYKNKMDKYNIEKEDGNYKIKITYNRVEPRGK